MKKIHLFLLAVAGLFASCSQPCPECPTPDYTTFEANKATVERLFSGFENKTPDGSILAEDFREVGTGMDEPDRNKAETLANWNQMMNMMDMELKQAIYLPGIDTTSFSLDGSVRYYGTWEMTIGEASKALMAYGSMDFNENGEITSVQHYADFTATVMSLMGPAAMEQMMSAQGE